MKTSLFFLFLVVGFQAIAQTYILDNTFGNNGTRTIENGFTSGTAVLHNGFYYLSGGDALFAKIAKVDYNGNLVSSFGSGGFKTLDPSGFYDISIRNIKTAGNSIYAYGGTDTSTNNCLIYKINEDGSFDSTFGTNGCVIMSFGIDSYIEGMVVDASGKLYCMGYKRDINQMILFRVNTNGTLDYTFDASGFKTFGQNRRGYLFTPYNNGFLMVCGIGSTAPNIYSMSIIKVDADGNTDNSFGVNGIRTVAIPQGYFLDGFSQQYYDEKLYLTTFKTSSNVLIYDLVSDEIVSHNYSNYTYCNFNVSVDGIYLTGFNACGITTPAYLCQNNFNLRKLHLDGTPDPDFQNNTVYTYYFPSSYSRSWAIVKDDNSKIFISGSITANPNTSFGMIRLTEGTLGTAQNDYKNPTTHPNPFENEIQVNLQMPITDIELYDVSGRLLAHPKFEGADYNYTVNLSFLSQNGTYFLRLTKADGLVVTQKIIRK